MLEIKIKYVKEMPFTIEIWHFNNHIKSYSTPYDLQFVFDTIREEIKSYEKRFTESKENGKN